MMKKKYIIPYIENIDCDCCDMICDSKDIQSEDNSGNGGGSNISASGINRGEGDGTDMNNAKGGSLWEDDALWNAHEY